MRIFLEFKDYLFTLRTFWILWGARAVLSIYISYTSFIIFTSLLNGEGIDHSNFLFSLAQTVQLFLLIGAFYLIRKDMDSERPVTKKDFFLFLLRLSGLILALVLCFVIFSFALSAFGIGASKDFSDRTAGENATIQAIRSFSIMIVAIPVITFLFSVQIGALKVFPGWENLRDAIADREFLCSWLLVLVVSLGSYFLSFALAGIPDSSQLETVYKHSRIAVIVYSIPVLFYEFLYALPVFAYLRNIDRKRAESKS
ncbi:putative membrane protein [Leptospira fainei serovar Hurstbridge str. BUT 6]|uniref:Membrane protein n=1 Tax=Leptospira fainei serovar Hurstbridge str. BUT 6 TaxID=1193011 RepID=S3VF48_9LEPT|nr:hypothetical protein [Leptospira fainei]EPG75105.1 putative membrane protein [Leptospira fainei serovar Hurstbridge str. BUT 6]